MIGMVQQSFLNNIRYFKFGCVLLGMLTLFNCQKDRSEAIELVTATEMKEILEIEGIQLVDVRTPGEYKQGHLPNALNIDFLDPNFEVNIQQLDKTKAVIVYCQRGSRSAKCASQLIVNGFVKIYDLDRGFSKWKSRGFEVEN